MRPSEFLPLFCIPGFFAYSPSGFFGPFRSLMRFRGLNLSEFFAYLPSALPTDPLEAPIRPFRLSLIFILIFLGEPFVSPSVYL